MTQERLSYLQGQFDRWQSNFLGHSVRLAGCSSFDAPDTESASSSEWIPIIHFECRTLYRRGQNGLPVAINAWIAEGVIVRAWKDDFRNAVELIGRPLVDVTKMGRAA